MLCVNFIFSGARKVLGFRLFPQQLKAKGSQLRRFRGGQATFRIKPRFRRLRPGVRFKEWVVWCRKVPRVVQARCKVQEMVPQRLKAWGSSPRSASGWFGAALR